jgi:hypothetical protein
VDPTTARLPRHRHSEPEHGRNLSRRPAARGAGLPVSAPSE